MAFHTKLRIKPLRIWFEKRDEFIKIYDGIRYLVQFGPDNYHAIYSRTKYLISEEKWYYRYY